MLLLLAGGALLVATWVMWLCFNAEPGRVGLEFCFDLVFYYYPMLEQASERLRAGEMPLWNPYQCCGVPFLATAQAAVFYPPTWLTLFLPVGTAIKAMLFGQVLAAGVFAALFFRALGKSVFASAIGGMLFIFACIMGQIYWPSQVSTIVWLPFLMWCVERFVQTARLRWWALFTAGVTMQALAGFPQFMVYTFYLLIPYFIFRLIADRFAHPQAANGWAAPARKSAALAGGCALAVGLASIQLIPTFELARNTARSDSMSPEAVHYLESERGIYLTLPGLLSNMFDPSAKMITFDFPDGSGYLGTVTPLMIVLGLLLGRRDPKVWFFVAAGLISCVLAFGYNDYSGWLYRIYAKLPTGGMFRTPSRLLLLTYFSLIAIAVFGLDRVGQGLCEMRGKTVLRIVFAVLALGFLTAARNLGGDDGIRLAAAFLLLVLAAYLVGHYRPVLWSIKGLFVALLIFDLANAIAPYGSLRDIPIEWAQRPHWAHTSPVHTEQVLGAARDAGLNRVALPYLRPTKLIQPMRFYMVTEYEPLLPERWNYVNRTMGGEPGFVMSRIDPDKYGHFYDIAGVSHLFRTHISDLAYKRLGPRQYNIQTRQPALPSAGVDSVLEERTSSLPRAYLVSNYEVCSPTDALKRFVDGDFDYRRAVLLEERPYSPISNDRREARPAEIRSYTPQRVVIRSEASEPRLLVLTDTFFPGWRAHVDGKETSILRANYLFRAVVVPAGVHEVVFEYQPTSFRAGACVSGLALLSFAGSMAWVVRARRRVARLPRTLSSNPTDQ